MFILIGETQIVFCDFRRAINYSPGLQKYFFEAELVDCRPAASRTTFFYRYF